ncbi:MAG: hypothetical protein M0P14_03950 [Alkaliphilus sp.]|nr:hypothetical protein [Alkaliphilus sp.]
MPIIRGTLFPFLFGSKFGPDEKKFITKEDEKYILHARDGDRNIIFEYALLDAEDNFKKKLDSVISCRIDYKSLSSLKLSANIRIKEDVDIDYLNDRIQPIIKFQKGEAVLSFPLGILLLNSPTRRDRKNAVYREIECYSKLQILQEDKFGERYFISASTNYTTAVSQIITSAGETKINIVPSTAILQTDKEYDIEMSKLEIINELLSEINYNSLRVDVDGYFISGPYVLPVDRQIEYEYIDDELSVIVPEVLEELDLFNVPNVFVRYLNNPERPPLRSVYINDNPDSITSTVSRGRNIVDIRAVEDVASQEALDDLTRRDAFNASQVYGHVEFETAIMPFHGYMNCLFLRYQPLGIEDKYIETSWSIDCRAGGKMQHTVRKVVNI